jgi:hypothetical protein
MILGRVTALTSSHSSPSKNHSGTAQWIRVVETNLAHDVAGFHLHHAFGIVRSASHPVLRNALLAVHLTRLAIPDLVIGVDVCAGRQARRPRPGRISSAPRSVSPNRWPLTLQRKRARRLGSRRHQRNCIDSIRCPVIRGLPRGRFSVNIRYRPELGWEILDEVTPARIRLRNAAAW